MVVWLHVVINIEKGPVSILSVGCSIHRSIGCPPMMSERRFSEQQQHLLLLLRITFRDNLMKMTASRKVRFCGCDDGQREGTCLLVYSASPNHLYHSAGSHARCLDGGGAVLQQVLSCTFECQCTLVLWLYPCFCCDNKPQYVQSGVGYHFHRIPLGEGRGERGRGGDGRGKRAREAKWWG